MGLKCHNRGKKCDDNGPKSYYRDIKQRGSKELILRVQGFT